jgi:hypothetical protein
MSIHVLIRFVMRVNKGPFHAHRIACRELVPLMQSGAREWITAETRFGVRINRRFSDMVEESRSQADVRTQ